ncbi:MAG: pyrimidine 5'-nucleotidase [Chloroflexota bacterium]
MKNQIDTLLFDLDATLYPESNGLWKVIRERIVRYMDERMHIPIEHIDKLRDDYYVTYGTTLQGLEAHYDIDPADYLNFVHNIQLSDFIQPDTALREMLLSIPHRRWIFTNSDKDHTVRVLAALGIEDCFDGIVDVWAIRPHCKPQKEAYQMALKLADIRDPQQCVFLDDSTRNLVPAQEMGIYTVLVGAKENHPSADRIISGIHELPRAVPEIWQ